MDELAGLLSRERLLLELVLYKLVSLRHLLASGEARFLQWAADEIERAVQRLHRAELQRGILVASYAADEGLEPDRLTLRRLAEESPEPWRTILEDHRRAFLSLTGEIDEVGAACRRLADGGSAAVTAVLDTITGRPAEPEYAGAATYGPSARWDTGAPAARVTRTL